MKGLAKQICSLIEQESNADCRGCMINPRCYVIDKFLAFIENEKRKAVEDFAESLKDGVSKEVTRLEANELLPLGELGIIRRLAGVLKYKVDKYIDEYKAADNDKRSDI